MRRGRSLRGWGRICCRGGGGFGIIHQFFVKGLLFVAHSAVNASADGFCQFAAGLELGEDFFGGRGVGGHFLAVGELGALALALELEVVKVGADDVDLLVEDGEKLLAALDVFAELEKLAGDAAAGQVASLNCWRSSASRASMTPMSS